MSDLLGHVLLLAHPVEELSNLHSTIAETDATQVIDACIHSLSSTPLDSSTLKSREESAAHQVSIKIFHRPYFNLVYKVRTIVHRMAMAMQLLCTLHPVRRMPFWLCSQVTVLQCRMMTYLNVPSDIGSLIRQYLRRKVFQNPRQSIWRRMKTSCSHSYSRTSSYSGTLAPSANASKA